MCIWMRGGMIKSTGRIHCRQARQPGGAAGTSVGPIGHSNSRPRWQKATTGEHHRHAAVEWPPHLHCQLVSAAVQRLLHRALVNYFAKQLPKGLLRWLGLRGARQAGRRAVHGVG